MTIDRLSRGSFLAGASALALAATPALAAAADLRTIMVGNLPAAPNACVNFAQDNGFFKDVGLDCDISFGNNGNAIWAAVIGGSLDIGAGNIGTLAVARSHGIPLKAIAPGAGSAPGFPTMFVMVGKNSTMRSGADFNNKVVGTNGLRTVAEALFRLWIDKNGGDSKTIKFIELPYPAMAEAVASGRADASMVPDPSALLARDTTTVLPVNYMAVVPLPVLITCFVATEKWLDSNADTARKFQTAMRRAAIWANGHETESHALLSDITKIDPKIVNRMSKTIYPESLNLSTIGPAVQAMATYGYIDKTVDPKDMIWP
jgi:NitT/TauT family transport system substrate-binding protein